MGDNFNRMMFAPFVCDKDVAVNRTKISLSSLIGRNDFLIIQKDNCWLLHRCFATDGMIGC